MIKIESHNNELKVWKTKHYSTKKSNLRKYPKCIYHASLWYKFIQFPTLLCSFLFGFRLETGKLSCSQQCKSCSSFFVALGHPTPLHCSFTGNGAIFLNFEMYHLNSSNLEAYYKELPCKYN